LEIAMRVVLSFLAIAALSGSVMAAIPTAAEREARHAAELEKALAGKVAGKPQGCITLGRNLSSQIIDETAIIYRESASRVFVNKPVAGCSSLRSGNTIVTRTPIGRLCSGDIARIVDLQTRFEGGACILGEFVPYTRPKG
jgi:hypothetical protein